MPTIFISVGESWSIANALSSSTDLGLTRCTRDIEIPVVSFRRGKADCSSAHPGKIFPVTPKHRRQPALFPKLAQSVADSTVTRNNICFPELIMFFISIFGPQWPFSGKLSADITGVFRFGSLLFEGVSRSVPVLLTGGNESVSSIFRVFK